MARIMDRTPSSHCRECPLGGSSHEKQKLVELKHGGGLCWGTLHPMRGWRESKNWVAQALYSDSGACC